VTAPHAPWTLSGESLACLVRGRPGTGALPDGLERAPGPTLVVAVSYTGSPVGPYLELAVGEPARLGLRFGWCITTMVVDAPESRAGGRLNWGYPKVLGSLTWRTEGDERELRWAERDIAVRGRSSGFRLPFLAPVLSLQRRADGPVLVPGRLRGLACVTPIEVEAPVGDGLAGLAGRHPGVHVAGMRFRVRPARHPSGFVTSLRAPLRAPEPAVLLSQRSPVGDLLDVR
jgi:hypothetical protein